MSPPLKILVIHNDYQQHGGERHAVDAEISLLRSHGHQVLFYGRSNHEIEDFGVVDKIASVPRAIYSRKTYLDIRRLVATEHPQIAHVHNVFPLISPSVYRALRDASIPIVQTVHNFRLMCPNGLFYTHGEICERCKFGNMLHAIRWRCYRNSYSLSGLYGAAIGLHRRLGTFDFINAFIVPSRFVAGKLVDSGVAPAERLIVLRHGLPAPWPEPGSFEHREPRIVYLGRLTEEKGLWTLLDAFRSLPKLRLRILGDGPLRHAIQHYIESHGLSNIDLLGFQTGDAKWAELRAAIGVVVPSNWYENAPLTIVESFVAGTAVVASNLGGLPETVIEGRTGLLFRVGDSARLRDSLAWLAENPQKALAMGRQAREMASDWHSPTSHYDRLLRVYQSVFARSAPAGNSPLL